MAENDGTQQQQQQQQAPPPWYQGIDAEIIGHIDNKGWKKDDPKAVVTEMAKAWKGLEQHFGAPADRIIRLPKDTTDEAGWKAVRQRLGAPADPKEYDFSAVKFADGTELDAGFTDRMRAVLHKIGAPKDLAPEVVKEMVGYLDAGDKAEAEALAAKVAAERAALAKEWGPNAEFNRLTAMQGAKRAAGNDAAAQSLVDAMEKAIGYKATMEFWRKIGAGTTEDTFIDAKTVNGQPVTREGALARRKELEADPAWRQRYTSGDAAAKQEMSNLLQIIAGE